MHQKNEREEKNKEGRDGGRKVSGKKENKNYSLYIMIYNIRSIFTRAIALDCPQSPKVFLLSVPHTLQTHALFSFFPWVYFPPLVSPFIMIIIVHM